MIDEGTKHENRYRAVMALANDAAVNLAELQEWAQKNKHPFDFAALLGWDASDKPLEQRYQSFEGLAWNMALQFSIANATDPGTYEATVDRLLLNAVFDGDLTLYRLDNMIKIDAEGERLRYRQHPEQFLQAEWMQAEKAKNEAMGGFENRVMLTEAARKATEARGYEVKPESFQVNRYESERERLDAYARKPNLGGPPEFWAYFLAVEATERNGADYDFRCQMEIQIMRTFEAHPETLPLRQHPSGLPWPKGNQLPPKWREGLFLRKEELREWAKEHCPDMLGSALLAAPPADAGTPPATMDDAEVSAVAGAGEIVGDDLSTSLKNPATPPGATAKEIAEAFPFTWNDKLSKCTSGSYKWLDGTWIRKGSRKAGDATIFSPVAIAVALVTNDYKRKSECSTIIKKHFAEWVSEWEEKADYLT